MASVDPYGELKLNVVSCLTEAEWRVRLPSLIPQNYRPGCAEVEKWSCGLSLLTWLERCCLLDSKKLDYLKSILSQTGRKDIVSIVESYEAVNKSPPFICDDVRVSIESVLLNGDMWTHFANKMKGVGPLCLPHNVGGQTHPFWTSVQQYLHFGVTASYCLVSYEFMKAVETLNLPNKTRVQIDHLRKLAGMETKWDWPVRAEPAIVMQTRVVTQTCDELEVADEDVSMPQFFIIGLVEDRHTILHVKGGIDSEKKGIRALEKYASLPQYAKTRMGLFESAQQMEVEKEEIELEDGIAVAMDDEEEDDEKPKRELHLREEKPRPQKKGVDVTYEGKKIGSTTDLYETVIIAQRPECPNNSDRFKLVLAQDGKGSQTRYTSFQEAVDTAENLAGKSPEHQFGVYLCIKQRSIKQAKVVVKTIATVRA